MTGAHAANITALAAARHEMLRRARWDVEAMGLQGAPRVTLIAGEEAHSSIGAASRMIGLGSRTIVGVATDAQGRMRPEALEWALSATSGPTIVCAQAGNVNTGACDPLVEIGELTRAQRRVAARRRRLRPVGGASRRSTAISSPAWPTLIRGRPTRTSG